MNYKQRVLIELIDLVIKITNLNNYLDTAVITPQNRELLLKQEKIMCDYQDVLEERLLNMLDEGIEEKEPKN